MKKKLFYSSLIVLVLSILLCFGSFGFKNNKTNDANNEKLAYKQNTEAIKTLKEQDGANTTLLNKVENNPGKIAKKARTRVDTFLDRIKSVQNKSDEKKAKIYKSNLKDLATKDLRNNPDLKNVMIPKKYQTYVSTSRAHSTQILVKEKAKIDKQKYFTITYSNDTNKVEEITEYQVRK